MLSSGSSHLSSDVAERKVRHMTVGADNLYGFNRNLGSDRFPWENHVAAFGNL